MNPTEATMSEIRADARSVRELLSRKYVIDYFQREYRWGSKQIEELTRDLSTKFLLSWRTDHDRPKVAQYAPYFLGSIILAEPDAKGRRSIIDGQQRLTSLTLLLITLRNIIEDEDSRKEIADLIYTSVLGTRSFNLDVLDRRDAMHALFNGQGFDPDGESESVR